MTEWLTVGAAYGGWRLSINNYQIEVMLFNHFKTAIKSLSRYKKYSVFNIAGLAAGIAVCLLIAIIIRFETSFDDFHKNKDQLYRVLIEYHHPGDMGIFYGAASPSPLPGIIKKDFPELKKSSGVVTMNDYQILVLGKDGKPEKKFKEKQGFFGLEPDFFDMFDFKWLAGSPSASLNDPYSAVITRETAEKYFGDWKNAVGKTISLGNYFRLKITGILENPPANTDFQFKIVTPYKLFSWFAKSTDWGSSTDYHNCYLMLPPGTTAEAFNPRLRAFFKKYRPAGDKDELVVQSLSEVHYYDAHSHLNNFLGRTIAKSSLRILWMIAAFILVIACVNFINLATAQAVNRSREVGVRKVLGSGKWQLRRQFLLETFLLVLSAVCTALVIIYIVVPPVGKILEIPLSFGVLYNREMILFLIGLMILVTFLAGFYPSILLSDFNPIEALKSKLTIKSTRGISLRRSLVVFQFIIAQALIISTIIMIRQMNYFRNQSMGFDKDAIIDVPMPGDSASNSKIAFLRSSLHAIPGVVNVSFSSFPPVTADNTWTDFKYDHALKYNEQYSIIKWVDPDYLKTYGLTLVAGRNISSDTAHEIMVNEQLLRYMGLKNPEEALNKQMDIHDLVGPIVGIVKDFHSTGFKDRYSGVIFAPHRRWYGQAGIKLSAIQAPATLKAIESLWNKNFPDNVYEYQFLDKSIESFYKQENQLAQLYKIFAGIAIFLGCLGLYGLASYMSVQRTKEVGIRKVLGASIASIVYLFSREFIFLISIAFLIASPIAWWFMHKWLQDYAFRIDISWWIFVVGGFISILIALITVGYRAIQAAVVNPVTSLRSE
jgi:putative ABC transport system permease protein